VLAGATRLGGTEARWMKVSRVLPERLTRRVERLRDELRLSVSLTQHRPRARPCFWLQRPYDAGALQIRYARRDGARSARDRAARARRAPGAVVRPARDRATDELRTFRADRITEATIGGPAAPAETGFDLVAHRADAARVPAAWGSKCISTRRSARSRATSPTLAVSQKGGTRLEMHADSRLGPACSPASEADFYVVRPNGKNHPAQLASRLTLSSRRSDRGEAPRSNGPTSSRAAGCSWDLVDGVDEELRLVERRQSWSSLACEPGP
jgi:hypothetical protein